MRLAPDLREVERTLCKKSFANFVKKAWRIIEPDTQLIWNWHLDVVADHVQAVMEGRAAKRNLAISVPPGSMKSTIVSVCTTPWLWLNRPAFRGIYATGSESIGVRDSLKTKQILDSAWYQDVMKVDWRISREQNLKTHFNNTSTGFRLTLPAGAQVTGERADGLFIDDILDAKKAHSDAERSSRILWWENAFRNRISDPQKSFRIVIMQRLHEEDLVGYLHKNEREYWDFLVIRQIYEEPRPDDPDYLPTSLGWKDHRQPGELMFPQRFDWDFVNQEKGSGDYKARIFAGQHQQRPAPAEGALFTKGYVKRFKLSEQPKFESVYISADTAFSEKTENDYSVIGVWGECREPGKIGFYLIDYWKEQAKYPVLKEKAKALGENYHPRRFFIESKASGQSLIQDLQTFTSLHVEGIVPEGDKVYRANLCVPTWESGLVWIPEDASWAEGFLEQVYGFPNMAHDDDVDMMTQALLKLDVKKSRLVLIPDEMLNLARGRQ